MARNVSVWLDEAEVQHLDHVAAQVGVSRGVLMRRALKGGVQAIKANVDLGLAALASRAPEPAAEAHEAPAEAHQARDTVDLPTGEALSAAHYARAPLMDGRGAR